MARSYLVIVETIKKETGNNDSLLHRIHSCLPCHYSKDRQGTLKERTQNMNFKNFWLNSCFGETTAERIEATFKSGEKVNYTMDTYHLLISDRQVLEVVSLETGEVYFTRDPETRELIYRAV